MAETTEALQRLTTEAQELYLPKEIDRLSTPPSPIEFLRNYVMPNIPVLIEDGCSHWPALKKWTNEYLVEKLGDQRITVAITPNGYADAPQGDYFVLPDEQLMTFKQFLDLLQKKEGNVAYIQKQNSSFTDEFSNLMADAEPDIPWATEAFNKQPDALNFWMGSNRSVTSMHKDHYENIYTVIRGQKKFILQPPTDLPCIPYKMLTVAKYKQNKCSQQYEIVEERNEQHCPTCEQSNCQQILPQWNQKNLMNLPPVELVEDSSNYADSLSLNVHDIILNSELDVSCNKEYSEFNSQMKSNKRLLGRESLDYNPDPLLCLCDCHQSKVPWIVIDPIDPNLNMYPSYRNTRQFVVTLNQGDVLYLPSLWFYHVTQADNTMAVNFWYDMEYDIKYNYFKCIENLTENLALCGSENPIAES